MEIGPLRNERRLHSLALTIGTDDLHSLPLSSGTQIPAIKYLLPFLALPQFP
jgi:hypothetical protein